ncbi:MAG: ATP-binding protein [Bacteroidota bacterium]
MKNILRYGFQPGDWTMRREENTKALYFALFVPLACMIFLLEWEPRILIFVFLGYSSGVIGFLLARSMIKSNQLLQPTDRLYRILAQNVGDLLIVHQLEDSSNVFVSPSIKGLLGYTPNEIICKYGTFLIHPDDRKNLSQYLQAQQLFRHPEFSCMLRVLKKDGQYLWMELSGKAVFEEEDVKYAILSFRDATERKEVETATRHFAEELIRKKTKSKHQGNELASFTAIMTSHDLKEPIRTIKTYVQLMDQKQKHLLEEEGKEYLHFIKDGTTRMLRMIEDVLSFSSLGTDNTQMESTDMNEIIRDVVATLQHRITETQASITYEELPRIKADARQFRHLFQNLISNAIKYRGELAPVIYLSWEKQNGQWQFRLRDNGIGIKEEFQRSVFDIFRRLHGIGSRYPGSGVGLAICKKILDNHQGQIWVESEGLGKGSTFCFQLPVDLEADFPIHRLHQTDESGPVMALPKVGMPMWRAI